MFIADDFPEFCSNLVTVKGVGGNGKGGWGGVGGSVYGWESGALGIGR